MSNPLSRLARLATVKVVSAGEAFDRDMQAGSVPVTPPAPPAAIAERSAVQSQPQQAIKRTFRYPKDLDAELKRFAHRYNLEKGDDEPDLTMDEVGVVMGREFLQNDPKQTTRRSRGLS